MEPTSLYFQQVGSCLWTSFVDIFFPTLWIQVGRETSRSAISIVSDSFYSGSGRSISLKSCDGTPLSSIARCLAFQAPLIAVCRRFSKLYLQAQLLNLCETSPKIRLLRCLKRILDIRPVQWAFRLRVLPRSECDRKRTPVLVLVSSFPMTGMVDFCKVAGATEMQLLISSIALSGTEVLGEASIGYKWFVTRRHVFTN